MGDIKRAWDLKIKFDDNNKWILLSVIDKVTKQAFGKTINQQNIGGRNIIEVYKEFINQINAGNVQYFFKNEPPLIVEIGNYTLSCPAIDDDVDVEQEEGQQTLI